MNSLRLQSVVLAALVGLGAALAPNSAAQPPSLRGLSEMLGRGGGEGGPSGRGRSDTSQARTAASRVVAYGDERTNSVVVRAPREVLDMIGRIVTDLDANPAVNLTVFIFPLANADAANVATILNDLFAQMTGTTGTSSRRPTTSSSSFFSRLLSGGSSGGGSGGSSGFGPSSGRFSPSSGGSGGGGGGRSAGGDEDWNPPPVPKEAWAPEASASGSAGGSTTAVNMGIEGTIYVVADTYTNSLLVLTDPANYERVRSIIASLDRSLPQALIKVLIAEVTHSDSWDIGAEFRYYNDRGQKDVTRYYSTTANGSTNVTKEAFAGKEPYTKKTYTREKSYTRAEDTDLKSVIPLDDVAGTLFNLAGEKTGMVVQILDSNLEMTLRAIQEAGNLEVLSRPSILAVNNQQANIMVGESVPFITSSRITQDGQTINTIQYQDIGIILYVTPHINDDGVVILDVNPEISAQSGKPPVQISAGVFAPVYAKRSATSRVVVPDRHTVVIGGLMQDKNTVIVTKVPLVGDIPYLGRLFQRKTTSKEKTELLIFLTPTVVQEYQTVSALTAAERDQAKLLPEALGGSSFKEYMDTMEK